MDKATSSQVASSASRELPGSPPRARWVRASQLAGREIARSQAPSSRGASSPGRELA
ncbi:UNVERIFIED_CONTAM: hypothetical protein Slati_0851600 [Sesamum latifolium]|uniref:Uncharacterized protein n=1 Tax=Sesamum latifolium TaxID=2727402 RepID=A0AAW2XMI5_9LAMI